MGKTVQDSVSFTSIEFYITDGAKNRLYKAGHDSDVLLSHLQRLDREYIQSGKTEEPRVINLTKPGWFDDGLTKTCLPPGSQRISTGMEIKPQEYEGKTTEEFAKYLYEISEPDHTVSDSGQHGHVEPTMVYGLY